MFAIVDINGKQYKVSEGEIITVNHFQGDVGSKLKFDQVLLLSDDKKTSVGTPFVPNATVLASIVAQERGEKLVVRRYKQKVRYRKEIGFRSMLTKLSIDSIQNK